MQALLSYDIVSTMIVLLQLVYLEETKSINDNIIVAMQDKIQTGCLMIIHYLKLLISSKHTYQVESINHINFVAKPQC